MGVQVDGRRISRLHFADDTVLVTPTIVEAERMLADFEDACGKVGLQLNMTKTMFMKNRWILNASFSLDRTTISECFSYVYLGREVYMMNDLATELGRRKRAAWGAYSAEDVVKKTNNTRLRSFFSNTTALTYASETWELARTGWKCGQRRRTLHREGDARNNPPHASESWNTELHLSSTVEDQGRCRLGILKKINWAVNVIRLNTSVGQEPSATGLEETSRAHQKYHRPML